MGFLSLGQGVGRAQLDGTDLRERKKKLSAHVAYAMKTPKMTSCSPSNFEGDGLHLNLLKKPPKFWELLICHSNKMLWAKLQTF